MVKIHEIIDGFDHIARGSRSDRSDRAWSHVALMNGMDRGRPNRRQNRKNPTRKKI